MCNSVQWTAVFPYETRSKTEQNECIALAATQPNETENEFERGLSNEHAHCSYVFTFVVCVFQATESVVTLCSFVRVPCDCRRVLMSKRKKKSRNALNIKRTIIVENKDRKQNTMASVCLFSMPHNLFEHKIWMLFVLVRFCADWRQFELRHWHFNTPTAY